MARGTTTLRVTYEVVSRSIATAEVHAAESPLTMTQAHQGLFGVDTHVTDVLLLSPRDVDP